MNERLLKAGEGLYADGGLVTGFYGIHITCISQNLIVSSAPAVTSSPGTLQLRDKSATTTTQNN